MKKQHECSDLGYIPHFIMHATFQSFTFEQSHQTEEINHKQWSTKLPFQVLVPYYWWCSRRTKQVCGFIMPSCFCEANSKQSTFCVRTRYWKTENWGFFFIYTSNIPGKKLALAVYYLEETETIGLVSGKLYHYGQASLPYGESGSFATKGSKFDKSWVYFSFKKYNFGSIWNIDK